VPKIPLISDEISGIFVLFERFEFFGFPSERTKYIFSKIATNYAKEECAVPTEIKSSFG